MKNWISRFVSLAMLAAFVDQTHAQSPPVPDAIKTIGSCVAIQTNVTTVEMSLGLRAEGSCEAPQGDTRGCTIEVAPTGHDIILDVTDSDGIPQCLTLAGEDVCAYVQNGPLTFQSQRRATQSFTAGSARVRMTTTIRQKRVQQTATDLPPSARFPLNAGRWFDVLRNRSSAAARLECTMADGDQMIFPIVGEADLSPNLRFVSKNSSEPTFDILTYRVLP
jgi:hypothetical protein